MVLQKFLLRNMRPRTTAAEEFMNQFWRNVTTSVWYSVGVLALIAVMTSVI
jgi:hypothetical protein